MASYETDGRRRKTRKTLCLDGRNEGTRKPRKHSTSSIIGNHQSSPIKITSSSILPHSRTRPLKAPLMFFSTPTKTREKKCLTCEFESLNQFLLLQSFDYDAEADMYSLQMKDFQSTLLSSPSTWHAFLRSLLCTLYYTRISVPWHPSPSGLRPFNNPEFSICHSQVMYFPYRYPAVHLRRMRSASADLVPSPFF